MKTMGLRINDDTMPLLVDVIKKSLPNLELHYGVNINEHSLILRLGLVNLILNPPDSKALQKLIIASTNDTQFAFFLKNQEVTN